LVVPNSYKILQKQYDIKDYFFYLGGFNSRKNLPNLIKALNNLYFDKKYKNITLLLAGNKNNYFKKVLQPLIQTSIFKIISTDYIKEADLPFYYQQALLFVYPSLLEGFGLPPLEAIACGTPALVDTNLPVIKLIKKVSPKSTPTILWETNLNNDIMIKKAFKNLSLSSLRTMKKKQSPDNTSWQKKISQTVFFPTSPFLWENIATDYYKLYKKLL
jgi:glycosyltransferase involved in cell wall biosynthesis